MGNKLTDTNKKFNVGDRYTFNTKSQLEFMMNTLDGLGLAYETYRDNKGFHCLRIVEATNDTENQL